MDIIVDVDGTLADCDRRRRLAALPRGKLNWSKFFNAELVKQDEPVVPVIKTVRALRAAGHRIALLSGRVDTLRRTTETWLRDHGVEYELLRMRAFGIAGPIPS